jgi:hypothetical protein
MRALICCHYYNAEANLPGRKTMLSLIPDQIGVRTDVSQKTNARFTFKLVQDFVVRDVGASLRLDSAVGDLVELPSAVPLARQEKSRDGL